MPVVTHGAEDRRKHGLGDNVKRRVHASLPQVKQASRAAVKVAAPPSPAAVFHTAISASRGMTAVPTPGKGM
jgi:hypothetical protein